MRHCVDTEMKRKGGGHPNRPGVSKHSVVGEMGQTFVGMAWDLQNQSTIPALTVEEGLYAGTHIIVNTWDDS